MHHTTFFVPHLHLAWSEKHGIALFCDFLRIFRFYMGLEEPVVRTWVYTEVDGVVPTSLSLDPLWCLDSFPQLKVLLSLTLLMGFSFRLYDPFGLMHHFY